MASNDPRSGERFLQAAIFSVALLALLPGCASKESLAPRPERLSSGWREASAVAPVADFDAYVADVTQELRTQRLPLAPSMAEAELASVAPFRIPPGTGCPTGAPRGLAVLVHGLSDTAFAMRDLASSFSRLCFESRVLLLPGHGTRPADLMVVDHRDWLAHVDAAVAQADRENQVVVLAGFSLGAALALAVAAESPDKVDAVIGLSPAYRLRSNFLARQARWVAAFRPWLDLGPREDFARYGAMPTRGIASTMAVLGLMERQVRRSGAVKSPWLVVQSEDDEVVDVAGNREEIRACKEAPQVWYGVGGQSPPPGEAGARATFNPHSPDLERRIAEFLNQVDGRAHRSAASQLRRP